MADVMAGCLIVAGIAWSVHRYTGWVRARKLGFLGLCAVSAALLAFGGAMACAGSHLERAPGDPGYCSNSTATAWLQFSAVSASTGLLILAAGAALAWTDRPPQPPKPRRRRPVAR